ncbi:hypothetical protein BJF90_36620 [Pseudonocardia sp. CNS-004]|nr:hypothetical protein BJF90_36620 [Pseudonocardia sp. CNS-004]
MSEPTSSPLVAVENLRVLLPTGHRTEVEAVCKVDLVVHDGERVGIVGESGSGKSVTRAPSRGCCRPRRASG